MSILRFGFCYNDISPHALVVCIHIDSRRSMSVRSIFDLSTLVVRHTCDKILDLQRVNTDFKVSTKHIIIKLIPMGLNNNQQEQL